MATLCLNESFEDMAITLFCLYHHFGFDNKFFFEGEITAGESASFTARDSLTRTTNTAGG